MGITLCCICSRYHESVEHVSDCRLSNIWAERIRKHTTMYSVHMMIKVTHYQGY